MRTDRRPAEFARGGEPVGAGELSIYFAEPPERVDVPTGRVVNVPAGSPLQSANHGDVEVGVLREVALVSDVHARGSGLASVAMPDLASVRKIGPSGRHAQGTRTRGFAEVRRRWTREREPR